MYSFWECEWGNNFQMLCTFNIPHPDRINPRKCVELLFSSLFVPGPGHKDVYGRITRELWYQHQLCLWNVYIKRLPFLSPSLPFCVTSNSYIHRQTDCQKAQSQMPVVCHSIEDIDVRVVQGGSLARFTNWKIRGSRIEKFHFPESQK